MCLRCNLGRNFGPRGGLAVRIKTLLDEVAAAFGMGQLDLLGVGGQPRGDTAQRRIGGQLRNPAVIGAQALKRGGVADIRPVRIIGGERAATPGNTGQTGKGQFRSGHFFECRKSGDIAYPHQPFQPQGPTTFVLHEGGSSASACESCSIEAASDTGSSGAWIRNSRIRPCIAMARSMSASAPSR